jgi:hypothetical protein
VDGRVIRAVVSAHVNAPAERVRALYADPARWHRLFPLTIRAARVVRREGDTTLVEVDHVEGRVLNALREVSPTRIELEEWKRRFDATFTNDFVPEDGGSRFTVTATVHLKWPWRIVAPLLRPLVLARMRRYVIEPLRAAAERGAGGDEARGG